MPLAPCKRKTSEARSTPLAQLECYVMLHFSSVKLVGGDASAKQADMTVYSYMLQARESGYDVAAFFCDIEKTCIDDAEKSKQKLQEMAWKQNINTAYSSSMGRLFDAAAALLDICHSNSYEGECAIKLEQAAHMGEQELQMMSQTEVNDLQNALSVCSKKVDDIWQADSIKLLVGLYHLKSNYSKEILAYLFHHSVANAIVELCDKICEEVGINQIVLSGGTFINRILISEVLKGLKARNMQVYTNEKVPCGDGCIALGQIYLATYE